MNAMVVLDFVGVGLFAATGALSASRKQLDIIGFLFLAAVTGVGGGTVRDLILGVSVFWVIEPIYILVCGITATMIYFTAHLLESRYRWLLWLDAVALSAYCVFGAYKGLLATGSPVVAIVMGTLTGTLGGILRDVLANEPSVLLRREIYVTAALAGAVAFVVADVVGLTEPVSAVAGFVAALAIRGIGLALGWALPTYRSRPGCNPDNMG
ncbi:trimeric intracellular cation channel family protein [Silicimonas algicola]|uniref:Putative membrane protein YeiH n=1 Tax=Silicimonas algicola TaxID=1826607 RepID=A0A316G950_9RHOB|nr:trimeric intracellular cation channel family protein [Silicimonas algicola]AZQ68682.1 trimeric intracellular cation channel family protein [Silicimonas algicola]PWK56250.1 putative membrane protein YeiH [Silicimonas algicola]